MSVCGSRYWGTRGHGIPLFAVPDNDNKLLKGIGRRRVHSDVARQAPFILYLRRQLHQSAVVHAQDMPQPLVAPSPHGHDEVVRPRPATDFLVGRFARDPRYQSRVHPI